MQVIHTAIPDVFLIEPKVFGDERGFFLESFNQRAMQQAGIDYPFVQDNHSRSTRNVLRGLHYQIRQSSMWRWICAAGRPPSANGWARS
jgi:dTDP-4-dehydrorhamnose 3,5-epimerase